MTIRSYGPGSSTPRAGRGLQRRAPRSRQAGLAAPVSLPLQGIHSTSADTGALGLGVVGAGFGAAAAAAVAAEAAALACMGDPRTSITTALAGHTQSVAAQGKRELHRAWGHVRGVARTLASSFSRAATRASSAAWVTHARDAASAASAAHVSYSLQPPPYPPHTAWADLTGWGGGVHRVRKCNGVGRWYVVRVTRLCRTFSDANAALSAANAVFIAACIHASGSGAERGGGQRGA